VAQAQLNGATCRIWMARATEAACSTDAPGTVVGLEDGIIVNCGSGHLHIEELQMPGGKRLMARDFISGHAIKTGMCFTT
jgi:methionyl-tRNA formyltransferase